jgi:hypothetical protein
VVVEVEEPAAAPAGRELRHSVAVEVRHGRRSPLVVSALCVDELVFVGVHVAKLEECLGV